METPSPTPTDETQEDCTQNPVILSRSEHPISRSQINPNALRVLYRLSSLGHKAYLVGGGVRDLLLGKTPKDFDIATDARPSKIKKHFGNSRIIGRRFRIAHVFFPNGDLVEVATFRSGSQETIVTSRGKTILRDNVYGTPEEDARRRDLTINGLFYDISTFSILDYVNGVRDLRAGIVRTIKDPDASFAEHPVRMIRVQRHACRTAFTIESNTWDAIVRNNALVTQANPSRLLEEMLKDLRSGAAEPYFRQILDSGLLDALLPPLAAQLREGGSEHPLWRRLRALDECNRSGSSYTTPLLMGVLLHTTLLPAEYWEGERNNPPNAWGAMLEQIRQITTTVRVSRRDTERMLQVLISYRKLVVSIERDKLPHLLQSKPYLSEALDFLEIDLLSKACSTEKITAWRDHAVPPASASPYLTVLDRDRADAPDENAARRGGDRHGKSREGKDAPRKRRRRRRSSRKQKASDTPPQDSPPSTG